MELLHMTTFEDSVYTQSRENAISLFITSLTGDVLHCTLLKVCRPKSIQILLSRSALPNADLRFKGCIVVVYIIAIKCLLVFAIVCYVYTNYNI